MIPPPDFFNFEQLYHDVPQKNTFFIQNSNSNEKSPFLSVLPKNEADQMSSTASFSNFFATRVKNGLTKLVKRFAVKSHQKRVRNGRRLSPRGTPGAPAHLLGLKGGRKTQNVRLKNCLYVNLRPPVQLAVDAFQVVRTPSHVRQG